MGTNQICLAGLQADWLVVPLGLVKWLLTPRDLCSEQANQARFEINKYIYVYLPCHRENLGLNPSETTAISWQDRTRNHNRLFFSISTALNSHRRLWAHVCRRGRKRWYYTTLCLSTRGSSKRCSRLAWRVLNEACVISYIPRLIAVAW